MPSPDDKPLRVCSFESRRGAEMKSLIERHGAIATIAPSMREIPLTDNPAVFQFAEQLLAGGIGIVVFMTGVGATSLLESLEMLASHITTQPPMPKSKCSATPR